MMFQSIVPLQAQRHRGLRLLPFADYRYASRETRVALAASELVRAAACYPIVFLDSPDSTVLPYALLGLSDDENLFVDQAGRWHSGYVPAGVLRYPFVVARSGPDTYALSIDETSSRFSASAGDPLFEADGQMSPLLHRVQDEQTKLANDLKRAAAFAAALNERGLIKPINVNLSAKGGERLSLSGIKVVDEKALGALPDDVVLAWFRNGYLGWVFAHLTSLGQLAAMARRKFTSGEPKTGDLMEGSA